MNRTGKGVDWWWTHCRFQEQVKKKELVREAEKE